VIIELAMIELVDSEGNIHTITYSEKKPSFVCARWKNGNHGVRGAENTIGAVPLYAEAQEGNWYEKERSRNH
jgi:hypothetical protein